MSKFLIVYATRYGQTEKIANYIGERLNLAGHSYDSFLLQKQTTKDVDLNSYVGVIVGAPVYAKGYSSILKKWCFRNRKTIQQKPSAFFSVCLGILQKQPEVQIEEVQIARKFLTSCNWNPQIVSIFAGALPYSKYNWFLKKLMHFISEKAGVSTETAIDYEYTDWTKVESFVDEFLRYANLKQSDRTALLDFNDVD